VTTRSLYVCVARSALNYTKAALMQSVAIYVVAAVMASGGWSVRRHYHNVGRVGELGRCYVRRSSIDPQRRSSRWVCGAVPWKGPCCQVDVPPPPAPSSVVVVVAEMRPAFLAYLPAQSENSPSCRPARVTVHRFCGGCN